MLNNSLLNPTDTATSTTTNQVTRRVELHTVIVERGLSWDSVMEMYSSNSNEPQGFYLSNQVKNNHRIAIFALYQVKSNAFGIYRPNTGLQVRQETLETLAKKYKRVSFCGNVNTEQFSGFKKKIAQRYRHRKPNSTGKNSITNRLSNARMFTDKACAPTYAHVKLACAIGSSIFLPVLCLPCGQK